MHSITKAQATQAKVLEERTIPFHNAQLPVLLLETDAGRDVAVSVSSIGKTLGLYRQSVDHLVDRDPAIRSYLAVVTTARGGYARQVRVLRRAGALLLLTKFNTRRMKDRGKASLIQEFQQMVAERLDTLFFGEHVAQPVLLAEPTPKPRKSLVQVEAERELRRRLRKMPVRQLAKLLEEVSNG